VRGMFVVARQAEQAIMGTGQVDAYQLVVGRRQHRDEMTLRVQLKAAGADKNKLAEELGQKFQDACRIKLDKIEFVAAIGEGKQGIVDERKWE
jgi:phenylacetate-coenzyme A ligase PaaK-like adenylate-forming protein